MSKLISSDEFLNLYDEVVGIGTSNNFILSRICVDNTNPYIDGLYEKTIEKLIKLKIPEETNMSLEELLDLPTYRLKSYINVFEKIKSDETKIYKELEEADKRNKNKKRK